MEKRSRTHKKVKCADTPQTTVISLKGKRDEYGPSLEHAPPDVVYIGRNLTMGGWKLKQSIFYNPYAVNKSSQLTREAALELYTEYLKEKVHSDQDFTEELISLKGKTLACWCKPCACHGDIIVKEIEHLTR